MNTPYIWEGDGNNKGKKRPLEATENVNINGRDLVNIYDRRRCRRLFTPQEKVIIVFSYHFAKIITNIPQSIKTHLIVYLGITCVSCILNIILILLNAFA